MQRRERGRSCLFGKENKKMKETEGKINLPRWMGEGVGRSCLLKGQDRPLHLFPRIYVYDGSEGRKHTYAQTQGAPSNLHVQGKTIEAHKKLRDRKKNQEPLLAPLVQ